MRDERSERLRAMLAGKRRELEVFLERQLGQQLGEDPLAALDEAIEVGDRASLVHGQDVELGVLGMKRNELRQIDEALARLAAGEYGLCADCAMVIDEGRLEIVPFATLCVDCKRRRELEERHLETTGRGFRAGFRDIRDAATDEDEDEEHD